MLAKNTNRIHKIKSATFEGMNQKVFFDERDVGSADLSAGDPLARFRNHGRRDIDANELADVTKRMEISPRSTAEIQNRDLAPKAFAHCREPPAKSRDERTIRDVVIGRSITPNVVSAVEVRRAPTPLSGG